MRNIYEVEAELKDMAKEGGEQPELLYTIMSTLLIEALKSEHGYQFPLAYTMNLKEQKSRIKESYYELTSKAGTHKNLVDAVLTQTSLLENIQTDTCGTVPVVIDVGCGRSGWFGGLFKNSLFFAPKTYVRMIGIDKDMSWVDKDDSGYDWHTGFGSYDYLISYTFDMQEGMCHSIFGNIQQYTDTLKGKPSPNIGMIWASEIVHTMSMPMGLHFIKNMVQLMPKDKYCTMVILEQEFSQMEDPQKYINNFTERMQTLGSSGGQYYPQEFFSILVPQMFGLKYDSIAFSELCLMAHIYVRNDNGK